MKKLVSLLLAVLLIMSSAVAFADDSEHYTFSMVYVDRSHELAEDDLYHFFCDKFNLDIEPIGVPWANLAETNSIMIMAGTMYDEMIVPNHYEVIRSYAEQDLLKAFPDGWEEKYPNIKAALDATGMLDYFTIDGKTYCLPGVNAMYYSGDKAFSMDVIGMYYRADWAEELGYEFGDVVTFSEFMEYLKACVDNDKAGNGRTIGLSTDYTTSFVVNNYRDAQKLGEWVLVDGQYVWGPTMEGNIEGIKAAKQLYNDGVIDPDFYTLDSFSCRNNLSAGLAAACYATMNPATWKGICDDATTAGMEDASNKIRPICITDDNGVQHKAETTNINWAHVFNPELSDEEFDRLLQLEDYFYSKEGNEVRLMGIPEVDWTVDENGKYVNLMEEGVAFADKYPSKWIFGDMSIHNTDFAPFNPATDPTYGEPVAALKDKWIELAFDKGYTAVDPYIVTFTSEAMSNYSIDINSEMSRIICDDTISMDDVEKEWNAFIESNAGIWQPVLDDLNAGIQ